MKKWRGVWSSHAQDRLFSIRKWKANNMEGEYLEYLSGEGLAYPPSSDRDESEPEEEEIEENDT